MSRKVEILLLFPLQTRENENRRKTSYNVRRREKFDEKIFRERSEMKNLFTVKRAKHSKQ